MKSKYIVLATTLLLAISSTASIATASTHGLLFPTTAVDTHGPRVGAIDFSVISQDPSLAGSLVTGGIQAPEWTFTAGSFSSVAASKNVLTGKTEGYTFDGIVFNSVQPIINTYDFRQAIQLLIPYTGTSSIETSVLSGNLAGVATADLMPCNLYSLSPLYGSVGACTTAQKTNALQISPDQVHPVGWVSSATTDQQKAAELLDSISLSVCNAGVSGGPHSACHGWRSGLYAQLNGVNVSEATIAGWSSSVAAADLPSLQWYVNGSAMTPFLPNLQYRIDDPLRTAAAVLFVAAASDVGLSINANGITDSQADGTVYTDFIDPLVSPGGYCSSNTNSTGTFTGNAGTNNCPTAVLNINHTVLSSDPWDMYTYGWVASSNFEFQGGEWMNTQLLADGINPGMIVSSTCDRYENSVLYNKTLTNAETGAVKSEACTVQNVPDVVFFYSSYLFANYINGWTGYANEPTTGPNTVAGAYYTFLNAHPTGTPYVGGTINYAVHGAAALGGLSPIYGTNWVWQADLWSELYDAPLATPPTEFTVPAAFIPYMLSGSQTGYGTVCTGTLTTCGTDLGGIDGGVQELTFSSATINTNGSITGVPGLGGANKPEDAYCIQNVSNSTYFDAHCQMASYTITNGEAITYTFNNNMTWTDGYPITAADYNFSLYALNVAGTPSLLNAFVYTPFVEADSGPFGLIATTVHGDSITMWMGDQSYFNPVAVDVPILPQHTMQYFNIANAFVFHAVAPTIDLSQSYATEYAANPAYFVGVCNTTPASCPLNQYANLEITSSAFELTTFNTGTGAGFMVSNLNYYRTAWYDTLVPNEVKLSGGSITISAMPQLLLSPGPSFTAMDTANSASLFSCSASIQKYSGGIPSPTTNKYTGAPTGSAISVPGTDFTTCGTAATDTTGPLALSMLGVTTAGNYKVTLTITYTYDGTMRTWYQYFGFNVASTNIPTSITLQATS